MTMSTWEDYEDDAGYSGGGGGMGSFDDFIDSINPLNAIPNAVALVTGGTPSLPGDNQDVIDQNSVNQAAANSDAQIARSMGTMPSWAGTPAVFMGRVTKLNAVMGTAFAVNTPPLDPQLMAVVRTYQQRKGLTADGEMGPRTEASLDADLGGAHPVTPPSQPLAVAPSQPTAPQGVNPASATDASGDKTKLIVGLAVGGVVLAGLAYFALSD